MISLIKYNNGLKISIILERKIMIMMIHFNNHTPKVFNVEWNNMVGTVEPFY
jgi:hypothetical protein